MRQSDDDTYIEKKKKEKKIRGWMPRDATRGEEYEPSKTDYWSSGTIRALFLTVIYMCAQQIEILSLDVA